MKKETQRKREIGLKSESKSDFDLLNAQPWSQCYASQMLQVKYGLSYCTRIHVPCTCDTEDGEEGAVIPLCMHHKVYAELGNVNWKTTVQQALSW